MKTRITELLDIQRPIVLSGMSWISMPSLVAAVSNAGGLGILATGTFSEDETRAAIREIRELTDKPFGANVSLLLPGAQENAHILVEEQVPVVNFSLGKGDWLVEAVHAYGGKVVATVTNLHHADRAQAYGTDAVIATGHEAAGHGGLATSLVLIPSLVERLDIPVIAAGGFSDGRGFAAALSLGADGIAMGTRFMMTRESVMHADLKKQTSERSIHDTVYSPRFDGMDCRMMDNPGARRAIKRGLDLPAAFFNSREAAAQKNTSFWKLFFNVLGSGLKNARQMAYFANTFKLCRAAVDGDADWGLMPLGQVTGLIQDEPSVEELLDRIMEEARTVLAEKSAMMDQDGFVAHRVGHSAPHEPGERVAVGREAASQ
ncbi:MAG: enoyl-ACP reductase [Deltaproteobacteria bacterium]|nr:enoyl-ACP reductase [Deltaproteobacteria bacterium]